MELLRDAPMDMGLGIKREAPRHYWNRLASPTRAGTMPTFVYMTRCDGCGHCVDICPVGHHAHRQDLPPGLQHRAQHVLGVLLLRQGLPQHAIDVRGYADFAPLGHSVRVTATSSAARSPGASSSGTAPRRTSLADHDQALGTAIPGSPTRPRRAREMRDSQLLYSEPKYIRMDDGGLHTLEAAGSN